MNQDSPLDPIPPGVSLHWPPVAPPRAISPMLNRPFSSSGTFRSLSSFLSLLPLLLVLPFAAASAQDTPAPPPFHPFSWQDGCLAVHDPAASSAIHAIAGLISQERFGEALTRIEGMTRADVAIAQIQLAMAVAGHPSCPNPESALESVVARARAFIADTPDALSIEEVLHQVDVYFAAAELSLSGLLKVERARFLAMRGHLDKALNELTPSVENRKRAILERVMLAAALEGTDASGVVLSQVDPLLKEALKTAPEDPSLNRLSRMLQQHAATPPATLTVRPENLMFPQWCMRRIRTLYWALDEAGPAFQDIQQALNDTLRALRQRFPNYDLARMYAGEPVPWGDDLKPRQLPPEAPQWAAAMRELRARVDYVVAWWFQHRQGPDGSLSGDWADDCAVLSDWAATTVACGNPVIESGALRLMDGAWTFASNPETQKTQAPTVNTIRLAASAMPAIAYGDPTHIERLFEHARLTVHEYTAVNGRGHRHFKSLPPTAACDATDGIELLAAGEYMRPIAALAWYAEIPAAVELLHDWALAWSDDATRLGLQKPGGVFPASIRFDDDNIDGVDGRWWDPGLGPEHIWNIPNQQSVLNDALACWQLTSDARVLDGIRGELDLFEQYVSKDASSDGPLQTTTESASTSGQDAGTSAWAAHRLWQSAHLILGPYRAATGDRRYDRLAWALLPSYARFIISGAPGDVEVTLAADLERMRVNLPLLTSEAPSPGRVALASGSLLGPLTGATASISDPPSWAVTWREVDSDFTALVRCCDSRRVSAWVYSFASADVNPRAQFWRLHPGRYELRLGKDLNADGVIDGALSQTVPFNYAQRTDGAAFTLPPRTLCLLEAAMLERAPGADDTQPLPRPDLAVSSRDIILSGAPRIGTLCRANVIIHNIGSANARDVTARMTVFPLDATAQATASAAQPDTTPAPLSEPEEVQLVLGRASTDTRNPIPGTPYPIPDTRSPNSGITVGSVQSGTLPYPADFQPKHALVTFEWRPSTSGPCRIEVTASCSNGEGEITSSNNRCTREITLTE